MNSENLPRERVLTKKKVDLDIFGSYQARATADSNKENSK